MSTAVNGQNKYAESQITQSPLGGPNFSIGAHISIYLWCQYYEKNTTNLVDGFKVTRVRTFIFLIANT